MIKAISIQDFIFKTDDIKTVRKYHKSKTNYACLSIECTHRTQSIYYSNDDDMLTDYYRILSALNGVMWSKKDD